MYLRKINSELHIYEFGDIKDRVLNIVLLLIKGDIKGGVIISLFEKELFIQLIEYLEKNDINYCFDESINKILSEIHGQNDVFHQHSIKALDIKNKLNDTDKEYVSFLKVIEENLIRRLYEHQAKASYHMAFSLNSCNFSVPGAGKTSIVYSAYSYLRENGTVSNILIIGPLSSYYPWKNEFFECFGYEPDITNLSILSREEKRKYLRKYHTELSEINFINYESLTGLEGAISSFLKKRRCMIVLDEAHRIKNPSSKRSISTLAFAEHATSRIVLTGTPIPNGYQDLLTLFEFIWPKKGVVGFRLNELKRLSKSPDSSKIQELMMNIDPFYVRIKKEYLLLPKPIHNAPIVVEMGEIQKEIYDSLLLDFLKGPYSFTDEALIMELKRAKLIRLMQASTNPSSIDLTGIKWDSFANSKLSNLIKKYNEIEVPEKFKVVLELIIMIQTTKKNKKVIIWSTFVQTIISLRNYLESNNIECELLYGDIDNEFRAEIIDRFHTDEKLKVIIANPAAVSESISLHKACHNAVYLEKNFNGAHFIQSKDRIHRVGLDISDEINYYYIFAERSIDSIIHKRLIEKEEMMLSIIEGNVVPLFEEGFESDLSETDIAYIEQYFRQGK